MVLRDIRADGERCCLRDRIEIWEGCVVNCRNPLEKGIFEADIPLVLRPGICERLVLHAVTAGLAKDTIVPVLSMKASNTKPQGSLVEWKDGLD